MLTIIYILFIAFSIIALIIIPFTNNRIKAITSLTAIIANSILSSVLAVKALLGVNYELLLQGSLNTGYIPLRIDALSAWFILIINAGLIAGTIYGIYGYGLIDKNSNEKQRASKYSLHYLALVIVHSSLIAICTIQNSIAFLISWEIMAFSSFILIIFNYEKQSVIKAGLNFLIQSHISVIFLSIAFIWIFIKTNSFDFISFSVISDSTFLFSIFLLLFSGFAIKAGFVPFHTWLPHAHPAAPSHISGIMSGVIIKIGIYGILRMLLLFRFNYLEIGYLIIVLSSITGLYGVMLAIIQHNLKKLLAYHSIENIGIIGIGIGLGCVGIGTSNNTLIIFGFAGALLHTLNHSLFKAVLFYASGNIYRITKTMNIEKLGGLIKKLPNTGILFLISSIAICGLPPLNGFVSEFLIYSGLFNGIKSVSPGGLSVIIFSVISLVLIGGLAIICFTKAYSIVFSGIMRDKKLDNLSYKENKTGLYAMYTISLFIILIGVFPSVFFNIIKPVINEFQIAGLSYDSTGLNKNFLLLNNISSIGILLIILSSVIYFIKVKLHSGKIINDAETWGCGFQYTDNVHKMQYTATSYIRTYRKLAEPLFLMKKKKQQVKGIFPHNGWHEIEAFDRIEKWLINKPAYALRKFFHKFIFLQNGSLQFYILYGIIFIIFILISPFIYSKIIKVLEIFSF